MTEADIPENEVEIVEILYESSPKHRPIPAPGRRGSICPPFADGPSLLKGSDLVGGKRYATDGMHAYCAQEHRPGRWHGYPVGWVEVPPRLVQEWISSGKVSRRTVRKGRRSR
jgi:hypothetical protein